MSPDDKDTDTTSEVKETVDAVILTKADSILMVCFEAHGGNQYYDAHFSFSFRDIDYEFQNDGASYVYKRKFTKKESKYVDVLDNGSFSRTIDDKPAHLNEEDKSKFSSSVNSVIYFATLPHKLLDAAVMVEYGGVDSLKGNFYQLLKVSFKQEGGGEDFDDEYLYWINQGTNQIDYLAYNYQVNGGGVRFRSAYNVRKVEAVLFQDYVNYKAPVGTKLKDLSRLFESGELEELSRIETKNIVAL